MQQSSKAVVAVAAILGGCFVIAGAIDPSFSTPEAFALVAIAAPLAGIYIELAKLNKQARED